MSNTDKLREFAEKYKNGGYRIVNDYAGNKTMQRYDNENELLSELNALISENYVAKAKYDEAVRQRDELKEALNSLLFITTGKGEPCGDLNWDAAEKRAINALKNSKI